MGLCVGGRVLFSSALCTRFLTETGYVVSRVSQSVLLTLHLAIVISPQMVTSENSSVWYLQKSGPKVTGVMGHKH